MKKCDVLGFYIIILWSYSMIILHQQPLSRMVLRYIWDIRLWNPVSILVCVQRVWAHEIYRIITKSEKKRIATTNNVLLLSRKALKAWHMQRVTTQEWCGNVVSRVQTSHENSGKGRTFPDMKNSSPRGKD